MDALRYGIIGINGFAAAHLEAAEELEAEGLISIQGVAEPFQDRRAEKISELRERGVAIYEDYREMLSQEERFDIVSVPTPIPLHVPMALACFEHGANVLLEKPPAVLVQQVDQMLAAAKEAGCLCQVGFQNTSGEAARELKRQVSDGAIGRVREMTVTGYWQRLDSYYARTGWAGKVRLGKDWVLDGPLNNPLCHYIHQALFIGSPEENRTLRPTSVRAELYHAHPIEGEDIVCARAHLEGGAVLNTYLTLCAPQSENPHISLLGEDGTAEWERGRYTIRGADLQRDEEGEVGSTARLMRNLARAIADGEELWSPLRATRNVILHNNGCYESSGAIRQIPVELIKRYTVQTDQGEDTATEVRGLMTHLWDAAEKRRLLSETGVTWATPTEPVSVDFDSFDPSKVLAGW